MTIDKLLRDQVIERLLAVSDVKISASDVNDATSLRETLDINSMLLVALAADLEHELGINLDDDELGHIQTIADLFGAIDRAQLRNGPA